MAVTATPIFPQSVNNAGLQIVNATSTTITTLLSAGTNGSKIEWINAQTTDTSANNVFLYLYNGTTSFPLTEIQVAASSGNATSTPAVSLLTSTQLPSVTYDANGNKYLYLASGWSLQVSVATAVTSGKTLTIVVQYENF